MRNVQKYSPKECLALIIIASEKAIFKEFNNFTRSLEQILLQNINRAELLEKINYELLAEITNYWELKKSQIMAYGYIVFNHFKISNEKISPQTITKTFIYQMKLYSPDNAIEFVKKNFNVNLDLIDKI